MWLLNAERNEERFIAERLLLSPSDDLADIVTVLVLKILQPTSPEPGRCLGIQESGDLVAKRSPFGAVWSRVNRADFRLEPFLCLGDDRQFVILKTVVFVPRNFTWFPSRRMKDFSHTRSPIAFLLEELVY